MPTPGRLRTLLFAATLVTAATALAAAPARKPQRAAPKPAGSAPHPEAADLFEREIRPILVAECQSCHGPKLQQGDLRLSDRAGLMKGGSKGPAVIPGDPARSPLIQAVRHQGGLKMPPGKQLPAAQVAALERWVRAGAPWPESGTRGIVLGDQTRIFREAKTHWA